MSPKEEKQLTILVVDDDEAIRSGFAELLSLEGYQVLQVPRTNLALNILDHQTIDLLITDILMPGESGLTLIQEAMIINKDCKIICISGGGKTKGAGLLKLAEKFGAAQTLQKPISAHRLISAVDQVLKHKDEISI